MANGVSISRTKNNSKRNTYRVRYDVGQLGAKSRQPRSGVAVTLALQGEGTHSLIDGQRVDWSTGAVQITPPTTLHSHHNRGSERMRALIFQDETLHYYTRTPGFSLE